MHGYVMLFIVRLLKYENDHHSILVIRLVPARMYEERFRAMGCENTLLLEHVYSMILLSEHMTMSGWFPRGCTRSGSGLSTSSIAAQSCTTSTGYALHSYGPI